MSSEKFLNLKKKADHHTPSNLVNLLGFQESVHMACNMLINDEWDEFLQKYAALLLEETQKKYPTLWNSSWRYDALLGYTYHIILKYDERYLAYKRAFNKIQPPPPELLVAMARCCIAPGKPPITEEEAIVLVKQAIKTTPYIEGISLLIGLYKSIGNNKEQMHWENILSNIQKTAPHLPSLDQICF